MAEKNYISRIKLADGSIVEIKDPKARELLEEILSAEILINCGTAENHTAE